MNLAAMQPYFFPYLGYFSLILAADEWVAFDLSSFTKKSWITRNRIANEIQDWSYISIPVSNGTSLKKIYQIDAHEIEVSKQRILNQLSVYKKHAPNYLTVIEIVQEGFRLRQSNSIVDLNLACLKSVCRYLGISFNPIRARDIPLNLKEIHHSGSWALEIAKGLNATTYINPISGQNIFHPKEFHAAGIDLGFLHFSPFHYASSHFKFVENLSIIDLMMWNSPSKIREAAYLNSKIIKASI